MQKCLNYSPDGSLFEAVQCKTFASIGINLFFRKKDFSSRMSTCPRNEHELLRQRASIKKKENNGEINK